jgi:hypothetical protein
MERPKTFKEKIYHPLAGKGIELYDIILDPNFFHIEIPGTLIVLNIDLVKIMNESQQECYTSLDMLALEISKHTDEEIIVWEVDPKCNYFKDYSFVYIKTENEIFFEPILTTELD